MSSLKEIVDNKPMAYIVSVKHNLILASYKDVIKVDTIFVQEEEIVEDVKRFMIFFKKKTKRVIKKIVKLNVKDLPIGTMFYLLEYDLPDRRLGNDNNLYTFKENYYD